MIQERVQQTDLLAFRARSASVTTGELRGYHGYASIVLRALDAPGSAKAGGVASVDMPRRAMEVAGAAFTLPERAKCTKRR